jgi:hypothetical protein
MLSKIIQFLSRDLLKQKSWRNLLFFGWRWYLLVAALLLLFIPLFVFGVFFPLMLVSIILITILLFYKFKITTNVKLTTSLILGITSFILNIILILTSPTEVYLIFSSLFSFFLLTSFYILIGLTKFNLPVHVFSFAQADNDSQSHESLKTQNQVIELRSILPLKQSIEVFSTNKVEVKNFNTNDSLNNKSIVFEERKNVIKDIIEVGDFKPTLIPKKPQFFEIKSLSPQPNLKITNPNFSNIVNNLKDLSVKDIFYINSLQLPYKRAVLDHEFFELVIVKLYLELCYKTDEILRKKGSSLEKRIKQSSKEYFDYDNTLYSIFCISEFSISNYYFPDKKDINSSFSLNLLNKQLGFETSNLLRSFIKQKIVSSPEIPKKLYYRLNRNKWREVLEKLLETESNLVKLKQKCDELLDLNSQNPSQYLIYFELFKEFVKKSKTASLWYYYKYYELLTFKNYPNSNLPEPKSLPASIIKTIFADDEEKLKQFEIICKTRNPLNNNDEVKKEEIKDLFKIKRKELKLDLSETQKAHQTHFEMTAKLNQVLQEEDSKIDQNKILNTDFQVQKSEKNSNSTNNIADFFAGSTNSKSDFEINFSEIETELLALFRENNFQLNDSQVSDFAKSQKQFKTSLVQKINQKFYEIHEENLVEQNDQIYCISSYNQNLI